MVQFKKDPYAMTILVTEEGSHTTVNLLVTTTTAGNNHVLVVNPERPSARPTRISPVPAFRQTSFLDLKICRKCHQPFDPKKPPLCSTPFPQPKSAKVRCSPRPGM